MSSRWVAGVLLLGAFALGTGASVEGVQRAREWQRAGDLAAAGKMWDAAYQIYTKIAETFPDTRHGQTAARRAREMRAKMLSPARSSAREDPFSWIGEALDFVIFP